MERVVKYPALLVPSTTQALQLPKSGRVLVPKAKPSLSGWTGQAPVDTYNGKQVLNWAGRPAFAELAVLWALLEIGWDGVWIDTYSNVFRVGYWDNVPVAKLPAAPMALLARVREAANSRFGPWDVFCWRGPEVLFAECKRATRDAIRNSQIQWLQAALDIGLAVDDFLVVEWTIAEDGKGDICP
jgi:hypothetical protein